MTQRGHLTEQEMRASVAESISPSVDVGFPKVSLDAREHLTECGECRTAVSERFQRDISILLNLELVVDDEANVEDGSGDDDPVHPMTARLLAEMKGKPYVEVCESDSELKVVLTSESPSLDAAQQRGIDAAVARMSGVPERRVIIRCAHPAGYSPAASLRLAVAARDYMEAAGVAEDRIHVEEVEEIAGVERMRERGAVRVVVEG